MFRFKPANENTALIELTILKVSLMKFQASTLDQCYRLIVKRACTSACENPDGT